MVRSGLCAISIAALIAAGCESATQTPPETAATQTPLTQSAITPPPPAHAKVVKTSLESVGLDASALDRSVDPCQDFYQFACGGWMAKTEIPADKPMWGRSFMSIRERNVEALRTILEEAKSQKSADPVTRKIGAYYGACMDEAAIDAAKAKPLEPLLATVKKVNDKKSLAAAVGELHRYRVFALFDISDLQDSKDASKINASLDQDGMGLPERDHYLKEDDKSKELRAKYKKHVEEMMKLAGYSAKDAAKTAEQVMRIETGLAKVSKSPVELRDPQGTYNKVDRTGLEKAAPDFDWNTYFNALGFSDIKDVNVTSVAFFEGMNKLLGSVKPAEWQTYLAWQVVGSLAPLLSKDFVDENFKFVSALTGQKQNRARWKRCVDATDTALGDLVAQPYVNKHFAASSKQDTVTYVRAISRAFGDVLRTIDWMDEPTRKKAFEKLDAMAYLIGYPPRWRSYDFEVDPQHYAENALAAEAFEQRRKLAKIGKPVDREEWQMTAPTVNAYYEPRLNHMVFPAGILQPPFYSAKATIAVNLGAMGMVVGHELTHGFDDEGSQFDARGNMSNGWSAEVGKAFQNRAECVVQQYGEYEPIPGLKLNGKLTLGENIADNAGIKLAFMAYRALRKDATEVTEAEGFNEDQQFFVSMGQSWCSKLRDEFAELLARVDPHSPARYRINGPLANLPAFAEAFQCKEGTPMRRKNACSVW